MRTAASPASSSLTPILSLTVVLALLSGCAGAPRYEAAPVESRDSAPVTVSPRTAPQLEKRQVEKRQAPPTRQPVQSRKVRPADAPVAKPLKSYSPPPAEGVAITPEPDRGGSPIPATGSVAVVSLINNADRSVDPNRAAAVLERALRIEPNNPVIWHRLAASRLQQGRFAQAEAVALKSNALEAHNVKLWQANWAIVAEARTALGDHGGAAEAERKRRSGSR